MKQKKLNNNQLIALITASGAVKGMTAALLDVPDEQADEFYDQYPGLEEFLNQQTKEGAQTYWRTILQYSLTLLEKKDP